MRNLLLLLIRLGSTIIFIVLQIICFYLIINFNDDKQAIFLNTSNILIGNLNAKVEKWQQYFQLEDYNLELRKENALLIQKMTAQNVSLGTKTLDSVFLDDLKYQVLPVEFCNASYNRRNNYITLCGGSSDGLERDMGVISDKGIIGIIKDVSPRFSLVMSILSTQTKISCAIKRNNALGSLSWDGKNPQEMYVTTIPKHSDVILGDTIITSGYSTIFPRGIDLGVVKEIKVPEGASDYYLKIEMFDNPTIHRHGYVIINRLKSEQLKLEKLIQD